MWCEPAEPLPRFFWKRRADANHHASVAPEDDRAFLGRWSAIEHRPVSIASPVPDKFYEPMAIRGARYVGVSINARAA